MSETARGAPGVELSRRDALVAAIAMTASLAAAEGLRPRERISLRKAPIDLEKQVPASFAQWRIDPTVVPLVPDPSLQARLDALYSETLARTYIDPEGRRVMLSIAYGSDQSSEVTSVHRPEFCYSSQGFTVSNAGAATLPVGGKELLTQRLIAQVGGRYEPISYWVTLDESATLPGLGRKLLQIRYGLHGQIPDGMLVRVSTVGLERDASFALQRQFVQQMYDAIPPAFRPRYFGA